MARPIDFDLAHKLARQNKLKYHSIVEFEGEKYTIWQDADGPIYSTKATEKELRSAGVHDTITMHSLWDSITYKVMFRTRNAGLINDYNDIVVAGL